MFMFNPFRYVSWCYSNGPYPFNGTNGATTDTNSSTNPIGNIFFNGADLFQQQSYMKAQVQLGLTEFAFVGYAPLSLTQTIA